LNFEIVFFPEIITVSRKSENFASYPQTKVPENITVNFLMSFPGFLHVACPA